MSKLVEEIKKLQQLKGLSDQKFAKSLEIDPALWSRIKNGKRQPGGKFLRALTRVYPELHLVLIDHMSAEKEEAAA